MAASAAFSVTSMTSSYRLIVSTKSVNPSSCSVPPISTGSTRNVNTLVDMLASLWLTMHCASTMPSASHIAAG